jgi:tetratricopeptide (TPR) repeat protein
MLTTQKAVALCGSFAAVVALVTPLGGCTPPGPRALLRGERLLREGDAEGALAPLKEATTHLPQMAQAWNHLGLAHHALGQTGDAARAYRQALSLDPNLAVARFNFGSLLLENGNPAAAVNELASFTIQRPKAPEGWVQRGRAELLARQFDPADRSFRNATNLNPRLAEAHNGIGLAQLHRNRPRDAYASFASASQTQPGYAPAVLNLAVVTHQFIAPRQPEYRAHALQKYRDYAALPDVPNREAVALVIKALDSELNPTRITAVNTNAAPVPPAVQARPPETNPVATKSPATNVMQIAANTPKTEKAAPKVRPGELAPFNPGVIGEKPAPTTRVEPPPVAVAVVPPPVIATPPSPKAVAVEPSTPPRANTQPPRLGVGGTNPAAASPAETNSPSPVPVRPTVESPAGNEPRYSYRNPSRPSAGNRFAAENHFAQGEEQRDRRRWAEALGHYEKAIAADPSFFEAQFYVAMVAHNLGQWPRSLSAYEKALALQPASLSARFNFALVLEKAGFVRDAATELERLLTDYPDADAAHLALGNLYAKRLGQNTAARRHYVRVLEINPAHSQGTEIRYWLRDHPP